MTGGSAPAITSICRTVITMTLIVGPIMQVLRHFHAVNFAQPFSGILAAVERAINFQASFLPYIFELQLPAIILFCCLPLMFSMSNGEIEQIEA